ncbi:putative hydrolase of the HAD superfamily [Meinhardsimonia xiamenensis]|jgi:putative hydrolase of the HAD superfamily|uniref:Putative hydrolase of the HAD superfamily n=1 Tax=Meinhardsimonia xiamenensis TaxID=990712 RepID=A0A1G9BBF4_9RHOB|nr:HAD-IA family hydrolase [Meinhardsimonia xiamenensis]PRX35041.1 putative hydrolase of the HAD superfamily [Meinhardsimonia xiamenensis]SDK36858.1 putative hydrolase of the HAD superfamily [Meinhardsimonia xiamenensis]
MGKRCALVLDLGGVLTPTLFELHDETERALRLAPGTLTWRGPFAPETDGLWQALRAGEIDERDYWRERAREVGALLGEVWEDGAELFARALGALPHAVLRPQAREALQAARGLGAALALLPSSFDALGRLPLPRDFLARFDAILDGPNGGGHKPDPAAFGAAAQALGLAPEHCLCVDDAQRNVAGARAAGMRALHFDVARPAASFRAALRRLTEPDEETRE